MALNNSLNVHTKKPADHAGYVNVSHAFKLIDELFLEKDLRVLAIETTFVRILKLPNPGFRNDSFTAIVDRPNIVSRTFR